MFLITLLKELFMNTTKDIIADVQAKVSQVEALAATEFAALKADVAALSALPTGTVASVDIAPVLAAIAAIDAKIDAVKSELTTTPAVQPVA